MKQYSILIALVFILLASFGDINDSDRGKKPVYVKPSIDYKVRYHKGHVRMPASSKKNAFKSQSRSRYYYQTSGKYRPKK